MRITNGRIKSELLEVAEDLCNNPSFESNFVENPEKMRPAAVETAGDILITEAINNLTEIIRISGRR